MIVSEQFEAAVSSARGLEDSPAKVALFELAAREADVHKDIENAFLARRFLIQAATFSGLKEKAIVAFSWCLAQADRDPQRFDVTQLFWPYKWVLGSMAKFVALPRQKVENMHADFARRLQDAGESPRTAYYLHMEAMMEMGDLAAAEQFAEKWRESPRGRVSDCIACERDMEVRLHCCRRDDGQALALAQQLLLDNMRCNGVPHSTYAVLLRPLLRLDNSELAEEYHRRGYRMIARRHGFVWALAPHLFYLAALEDFDRGLRLFERHLPEAAASAVEHYRLQYFESSAALLEKLARAPRKRKLRKFNLPKTLDCFREDGSYQVEELASWFRDEAQRLAAAFDRRNGNDFEQQWLAESRALAGLAGTE